PSSAFETSTRRPTASAPAARISRTAASSASSCTSPRTSFIRCRTAVRANSRPKPLPAPVMTATFPTRSRMASRDLEEPRRPHSAPDAHGGHDELHAAPPPFDQRMPDQACAGHPVRVPDGDGAAVDVEAVVGDAEAIAAVDDLHREGHVQLPQPDVVEADPGALEKPRN